MFEVEELWTQQDGFALDLCIGAVARDHIERALLTVEGAAPKAQREAEQTLQTWAERLGPIPEHVSAQVDLLRALLVEELGFRGDEDEPDHPDNSHLTAVLSRRRGLPILLSAIWMVVGRHAGIPVEGIGLPGHFVVRVGEVPGVFVDPFNGGVILTEADCRKKAEELTDGALDWRESFLDPVSVQALISRVCRNLVSAHNRRHEVSALYRTLRFLEAMRPEDPDIPLMRAQVAESAGAFPRALKIYRAIAQQFSQSEAAEQARKRLEALERLPVAEG